jgi:hypothetical protein
MKLQNNKWFQPVLDKVKANDVKKRKLAIATQIKEILFNMYESLVTVTLHDTYRCVLRTRNKVHINFIFNSEEAWAYLVTDKNGTVYTDSFSIDETTIGNYLRIPLNDLEDIEYFLSKFNYKSLGVQMAKAIV